MTMMKFEDNFVALERTIAEATGKEKSQALRRLYSLIEAVEPQPKYLEPHVEDDLLFDNVPL